MASAPILMYHGVADTAGRLYDVSPDRLCSELDCVVDLGVQTPPLPHLLGRNPGSDPGRCCVLTFDDGLASVARLALPLLAARGLRGVLYMISDRVGQPGYLDRSALRELIDAGWTIGTHGRTHRHLSRLSRLELAREWRESRDALEQLLSVPVRDGSLPGGRGGRRAAEEARATGLRSLATSVPGLWRPQVDDPMALPRVVAGGRLALPALSAVLRGRARALLRQRARHAVLAGAKRALGDRRYDDLRRRITGEGAGAEG